MSYLKCAFASLSVALWHVTIFHQMQQSNVLPAINCGALERIYRYFSEFQDITLTSVSELNSK